MKNPACRWSFVCLVMSSVLWTSSSLAFFCFSMGGGNRHRDSDYFVPPPYGAFSGGLPAMPYSPVVPQPPLTPVAPVETRNVDYPVQAEPVPKQHIFH